MIYFARQIGTVGPIKIGCSCAPEIRLKQLEGDYRIKTELIAQFEGSFTDERNLHKKFDAFRFDWGIDKPGSSEWFWADESLLAYIEDCKQAGRIILNTEECRERIWAERYVAGHTLKQIGDDFGVSRERVRQVLRKHGIQSLGWRKETLRKVVTLEVEMEIVRLGKSGMNQAEIANRLGLKRIYVSNYLRKNGVSVPRSPHPIRKDVRERAVKIAADYLAGVKTVAIKEKYGVEAPEIYRALKLCGVEKRGHVARGPSVGKVAEDAVEQYQSGKSLRQIAAVTGCTPRTVKHFIERQGVEARARTEQVALANRQRKAA